MRLFWVKRGVFEPYICAYPWGLSAPVTFFKSNPHYAQLTAVLSLMEPFSSGTEVDMYVMKESEFAAAMGDSDG